MLIFIAVIFAIIALVIVVAYPNNYKKKLLIILVVYAFFMLIGFIIKFAFDYAASEVCEVFSELTKPEYSSPTKFDVISKSQENKNFPIDLSKTKHETVGLKSNQGWYYFFTRIDSKPSIVIDSIINYSFRTKAEHQEYYFRTVGWKRIENEIGFFIDSFAQLKFFNVTNIKNKKCKMCLIGNYTHTLIYNENSDTTYYFIRPINEYETFFTFNKKVRELEKLTPDSLIDEAPFSFYGDHGFRDEFKIPLRYPESLYALDGLGNSYYETKNHKFDKIERFNFNKNYILLNCLLDKDTIPSYIVYKFGGNTIYKFKNHKEMIAAAAQLGIPNKYTELKTVSEYEDESSK